MHNIFYAAIHWVIFKLGTRFTSMSNGWDIHCLQFMSFLWVIILRRLVTLLVIHGVWCLFSRVNAAKSYYLTCQSLKIACLESISYIVLCTISHVLVLLSLLGSLNYLPLFRVNWWRIHQCLPSTNFFLSTLAHHLGMRSRNLSILWYLGGHFHYQWFSSQLLMVYIIDH